MGTSHLRTTAYHPAANGMVERFHRQLKAAIKCHETERWVEVLPIVLLGIRTSIKEDLRATTAQMVYGTTTIRLPGEFFTPSKKTKEVDYVVQLRRNIQKTRPTRMVRHGERKTYMFKGLADAQYVFVRNDAVRGQLQPPYDGPFEVQKRSTHNYIIRINGKDLRINTERLKPAHTFVEDYIEQSKAERERETPDNDADDSGVQSRAAENQLTRT
ncbi:uncharacterized protein LOC108911133, partial [Anoplophora glabripennis]|uniref:uncharacterized protein LOC108911133 n=1 Tax=Anoplophora glabripennis TaxID=217634 RepID=UPI000874341F